MTSFADVPLGGVLYTDVARDGTRIGPNLDATADLATRTSVPIIASGGVGLARRSARPWRRAGSLRAS